MHKNRNYKTFGHWGASKRALLKFRESFDDLSSLLNSLSGSPWKKTLKIWPSTHKVYISILVSKFDELFCFPKKFVPVKSSVSLFGGSFMFDNSGQIVDELYNPPMLQSKIVKGSGCLSLSDAGRGPLRQCRSSKTQKPQILSVSCGSFCVCNQFWNNSL